MKKATTEAGIKVSNDRITNTEAVFNSICKPTIEVVSEAERLTEVVNVTTQSTKQINVDAQSAEEKEDDVFVLVEASKLSMMDEFMLHTPELSEVRKFKHILARAISSGELKDFYRPKYDPCFNRDGEICFIKGKQPAVGKSYNWWASNAKKFNPERKSRLGTMTEYVAFLGVLIKEMVKDGWSAENAWYAVCINSKELGHYWNSENAKHDFEETGCREVCGFCDLANVYKILAEDENKRIGGSWIASGCYGDSSDCSALNKLEHDFERHVNCVISVGWLVLEN